MNDRLRSLELLYLILFGTLALREAVVLWLDSSYFHEPTTIR